MDINYRIMHENAIKNKPDKIKYCFITDNKRLAEKLIRGKYFSVLIDKLNYPIDDFIDTIESAVGRGGTYVLDYYYILLATKSVNEAVSKAFDECYINYNTSAWKLFSKDKDYEYYCIDEHTEELNTLIDKFINKCEGKKENIALEDNNISIVNNCYMKKSIKNNAICEKAISNFILEPVEKIELDNDNAVIKVKILTAAGKIFIKQYSTISFYKASEFKRVLNNSTIDLYFTASDEDLEDIKVLMNTKPYPTKTGLKRTGIQLYEGQWVYVGNNRTFGLDNINKENIVFVDENEGMRSNVDTVDPISKSELEVIKNALFGFNTTPKCLVILGFIGSCFVKEKLYKSGIKLNHLFMIGQAGSGKSTTLENVIMAIFGLDDAPTSADGITKFSLLKKTSNSYTIPFIIDEFKPYKLTDFQKCLISDILRKTYDKQSSLRGTASQKVNEYQHITPIILSGEGGLDETALTERKIQVTFTKQDFTPERTKCINHILNNSQLMVKLGRALIDVGLKVDIEEIKAIHTEFYNEVKDDISDDRVKKNIANILTGLSMIQAVFDNLKVDMPVNYKDYKNAIISLVKNDTLDGENSSKSAVDNMIELIDLMAFEDNSIGSMYIIDDLEDILYLDVTRIYKRLSKYIKDNNIKDFEYVNEKDFKKQLKDSSYCISNRYNKKFKIYNEFNQEESKTISCFKLDLDKMNDKLELRHLQSKNPFKDN